MYSQNSSSPKGDKGSGVWPQSLLEELMADQAMLHFLLHAEKKSNVFLLLTSQPCDIIALWAMNDVLWLCR